MTMIKQRHKYDCGIACLAMFLNEPYDHIICHLPYHILMKMV